jgi:hypothetical protein
VLSGIDTEGPFKVLSFSSTTIRPGRLKYCFSLGNAVGEMLGQLGVRANRGAALVAGNGMMHLTCDPADIASVALTRLREWIPELDE